MIIIYFQTHDYNRLLIFFNLKNNIIILSIDFWNLCHYNFSLIFVLISEITTNTKLHFGLRFFILLGFVFCVVILDWALHIDHPHERKQTLIIVSHFKSLVSFYLQEYHWISKIPNVIHISVCDIYVNCSQNLDENGLKAIYFSFIKLQYFYVNLIQCYAAGSAYLTATNSTYSPSVMLQICALTLCKAFAWLRWWPHRAQGMFSVELYLYWGRKEPTRFSIWLFILNGYAGFRAARDSWVW